MGISDSIVMQPEALQSLLAYDWPGNIRELQNIIARSIILSENGVIEVADLPPYIGLPQFSARENGDSGDSSLKQQLKNYELAIIKSAIEDADGDRKLAAKRLGIGISSLYRKLDMKFEAES